MSSIQTGVPEQSVPGLSLSQARRVEIALCDLISECEILPWQQQTRTAPEKRLRGWHDGRWQIANRKIAYGNVHLDWGKDRPLGRTLWHRQVHYILVVLTPFKG
jgi:hypothetical protein